jgi:NAD(P)-dependent dehydrogenase (short-subunit alcohol dehydrogenase family)
MSGSEALIVGGADGIGLATTRRLHEAGWRISVVDRDPAALDRLPDWVARAHRWCLDVTSPGWLDELTGRWPGGFDAVVDIVGRVGDDDGRLSMEVNYFHAYDIVKAEGLCRAQASLVFVASASSSRVISVPRLEYGPAKGALVALIAHAAVLLAGRGVRVNGVSPGLIDTPRRKQALTAMSPDDFRIPLGRFGEPDDVAAVIEFLASSRSRYVTGTVVPVDGGLHAMAPGRA